MQVNIFFKHTITVVCLGVFILLALGSMASVPTRKVTHEKMESEIKMAKMEFMKDKLVLNIKYYCPKLDTDIYDVLKNDNGKKDIYTLIKVELNTGGNQYILTFDNEFNNVINRTAPLAVSIQYEDVGNGNIYKYDPYNNRWADRYGYDLNSYRLPAGFSATSYPAQYTKTVVISFVGDPISKDLISYQYVIKADTIYTYESLENIINEYNTDKKYGISKLITSISSLQIGNIYRVLEPIMIEGSSGNNLIVCLIQPKLYYPGYVTGYGEKSAEFIIQGRDMLDSKGKYITVPNGAANEYNLAYTPWTLSGGIGYILKYKGTTEAITTAGFIRIVPLFEYVGINKYANYTGSLSTAR
jgi:hypothetical protein